jgi:hypothetical protein
MHLLNIAKRIFSYGSSSRVNLDESLVNIDESQVKAATVKLVTLPAAVLENVSYKRSDTGNVKARTRKANKAIRNMKPKPVMALKFKMDSLVIM